MSATDVIMIPIILFCLVTVGVIAVIMSNDINTAMENTPAVNSSDVAMEAFGGMDTTVHRIDMLVMGVFGGLTIALLITSWFIAGIPLFMFIYFCIVVIGVLFSAAMSNAWETMMTNATVYTTLTYFPIANNIMAHLPLYTAVIGFIGLVVMFAKPRFDMGGSSNGYD